MDYINIIKLRPELIEKINEVNSEKLKTFYSEISKLSNLSDKSYEDKEISSPFISILNNSHIVSYFQDKYQVESKDWLEFMLDINKLISLIEEEDIDVIIGKVDKRSDDFFMKYIPVENEFDKEFVEKLGITVEDDLNDLGLISAVVSEIIYKLMEENIMAKSFILEVIIDGIKDGDNISEIVNRINNVIIANDE